MNNFKNYLKLHWHSVWKLQLLIAALTYVIFTINYCASIIDVMLNGISIPQHIREDMVIANNIFMAFVIFSICASTMFGSFSTRQNRLSNLCLPVSTKAKYAAHFLVSIILPIIALQICSILADLTSVAIVNIVTDSNTIQPTATYRILLFYPQDGWKFCLGFITAILFTQSFFAAGSVFFPGKSFVKTLGIAAGLCVLIPILLYYSIKLFFPSFNTLSGDNDISYWYPITIMAVLTIGLHVLSYYRFKGIEVQNRW